MVETHTAHPKALDVAVPGVELILGGQKSGKSRRAECLANAWLAGAPVNGQPRQATLIATAQPWDAEMQRCIARHQADRAQRAPGLATLEEPVALAQAISRLSAPHHLLVVDCLTLWLTNLLMPLEDAPGAAQGDATVVSGHRAENIDKNSLPSLSGIGSVTMFLESLKAVSGPVVLVGNELGLGVIPMGEQVRHFVSTTGQLNQAVAALSQRVVLMVAGLPMVVKA
ncbi:MAG TPA: bifunctional adenosylcobinamide kinase/adenosylcobinamide-phosphate guanylyltransferase [Burkholderiaceae bacterium]|nr:bifunctional adenosylcobinamide kinase/adenosylcobinamide-phosphate guanylyltransferase [Burkholderiaceae bacterium]